MSLAQLSPSLFCHILLLDISWVRNWYFCCQFLGPEVDPFCQFLSSFLPLSFYSGQKQTLCFSFGIPKVKYCLFFEQKNVIMCHVKMSTPEFISGLVQIQFFLESGLIQITNFQCFFLIWTGPDSKFGTEFVVSGLVQKYR